MSSKKIFIADRIHPAGLIVLRKHGFRIRASRGISNSELIHELAVFNADVLIIRSVRRLREPLILRMRKETPVKLICTASSGLDHIDVRCALRNGIKVMNVPDGNFVSAAEHTIALILAISKNLVAYQRDMKSRIFDSARHLNYELSGKTIGIIGVGRVGSHVAKIARSLKMRVLGNDIKKSLKHKFKWIRFLPLRKLLTSADVVTIHTPLDEITYNLISENEFALMKKNVILINCARGGLVNENSLIKALKQRKVSYAGVDVFENEPHIDRELIKQEKILLTPHVAGKTKESIERISVQIARAIISFFK